MKWKTIKVQPKEGDRRTKRKFALFPVETNYDLTVWLETYESVQEYRYVKTANHHVGTVMKHRWVEIETIPLFVYP
jgi:hypothetical protein